MESLLYFFPTIVFEKEEAMSEDFNQKLEKWIIDYSQSNEEAKNWSKKFYGTGFTSYGSNNKLHKEENIFKELADGLTPHVKKFLSSIKAVAPSQIVCQDMWCTINKPTSKPTHA